MAIDKKILEEIKRHNNINKYITIKNSESILYQPNGINIGKKTHVKNILLKLEARNRNHAVSKAKEKGILNI